MSETGSVPDNTMYIVVTKTGVKDEVFEGWCDHESNAQYFVECHSEETLSKEKGLAYDMRTPEKRTLIYPGIFSNTFHSSVHYEHIPYVGCDCDTEVTRDCNTLFALIEDKKIIGWIEDESQAELLAKHTKAISYEALTLLKPPCGDIPAAPPIKMT